MRALLLFSVLVIAAGEASAQRPGSPAAPVRTPPAPSHATNVDATHRVEAQVDALSSALTTLTAQVTALQTQLGALQTQNNALQTQLQSQNNALQTQNHAVASQVTALQNQGNAAQTQLAAVQTQLTATTSGLQTLQSTFTEHRHCIAGLSMTMLQTMVGDAENAFKNYVVLAVAPPLPRIHQVGTTRPGAVSPDGLCG